MMAEGPARRPMVQEDQRVLEHVVLAQSISRAWLARHMLRQVRSNPLPSAWVE